MSNLITKDYQGLAVQFTGNGWFNATVAAENFGKRPVDWLKLDGTKAYLSAVCEIVKCEESSLLKTRRGKVNGGTWLHPKLAVPFARWLDLRFSIWCDEQIDKLIRGVIDAKRARHQAAASYKLMSDIVRLAREQVGKESKPYHYANEARLINWVLTGEFKGLDRDRLSFQQLARLALLEEKNSVLLASGASYVDRKIALQEDCKKLTTH